jgi:hypothetical protein
MWNYQTLKERFFDLANRARTDANNAKLKSGKAPTVFREMHDTDLARHDVFMYLATSHFSTKQEFLVALGQLAVAPKNNSEAFDEQKYNDARRSIASELIAEFQ